MRRIKATRMAVLWARGGKINACLIIAAFSLVILPVASGEKHAANLSRIRAYNALVSDYTRPSWHLFSSMTTWWDINAFFEVDGRYHATFLKQSENIWAETGRLGNNWGHATSRDLFDWHFMKDALDLKQFPGAGTLYSGHSVHGAECPTIILYVPQKGIYVAQSRDKHLENWSVLNSGQPVIPEEADKKIVDITDQLVISEEAEKEYIVFDPGGAWYDEASKVYYALIGNRTRVPGSRGAPSLFRSPDLIEWDYIGPLFKHDSEHLLEKDDTACVDFFQLGGKWVLINHVHSDYFHTRYAVGEFDGKTFTPESSGKLGYLNTVIFAPETFFDHTNNRRILFATTFLNGGFWGTGATQPFELKLSENNELEFHQVEELNRLVYNEQSFPPFTLESDERAFPGTGTLSMRIDATIDIGTAKEAGFRLAAASDHSEYSTLSYDVAKQAFLFDFSKSNRNGVKPMIRLKKGREVVQEQTYQEIPFSLKADEPLQLRIYRDGGLFEVIVNNRTVIVQHIYASSKDSVEFSAYTKGGRASFTINTAEIDATSNV